jgi:hypothetical protein
MKSLVLCPRLPVLLLLASALFAAGCSQKTMRRVSRAAGEEAALATLQGFLVSNNITSADHMVDAVRLVVEKKDYAGAAAAFAVALDEHNVRGADKVSSSQVISLMRKAVPTVKKASPRVASYVTSFCDHVEKQK